MPGPVKGPGIGGCISSTHEGHVSQNSHLTRSGFMHNGIRRSQVNLAISMTR